MKLTPGVVAVGGGMLILAYLVVRYSKEVAAGVGDVVTSFNPNSADNIFYKTANAVGGLATNNANFSLGGAYYTLLNGDSVKKMLDTPAYAPVAPTQAQKAMEKAPTIVDALVRPVNNPYGGSLPAPVFNNSSSLIH